MAWIVPLRALVNIDQFRTTLNTILAEIEALKTGYGAALPSQPQPDGRLFTLTTTNKTYQSRAGVWVIIT